MKAAIIVPTYWSREKPQKNDLVYDHPTPLNEKGTLGRLLKSLEILKESNIEIIIISCPTNPSIANKVREKVEKIINTYRRNHTIVHFSYLDLLKVRELAKEKGGEKYIPYLSLEGYSNIRNMCVILPHILNKDVAILIDDDEVFEDPNFVEKATKFIGKDEIYGIAGFYIQPHGGYKFTGKKEWWKIYWNNTGAMNKAFEKIDEPPQLKDTPFVFGGNMILHKKMFKQIPFDPYISRGEDIDFLCNAKSKGFKFLLDRKLSIKHLPPPGQNPLWLKMREDIKRFTYMRFKLKKIGFPLKRTMPYPGYFLSRSLYFKIIATNTLLFFRSLFKGRVSEALHFLRNTTLIFKYRKDALNNLPKFKKIDNNWKGFMDWIAENSDSFRTIIG
jgi:glycosyltransferase involved in cell wall biosynthesis